MTYNDRLIVSKELLYGREKGWGERDPGKLIYLLTVIEKGSNREQAPEHVKWD